MFLYEKSRESPAEHSHKGDDPNSVESLSTRRSSEIVTQQTDYSISALTSKSSSFIFGLFLYKFNGKSF